MSNVPTTIYRIPTSAAGFFADIDNCDPKPIWESITDAREPLTPGCVDRYITTDGHMIDCSIDSCDFGAYYLSVLEEL